MAIQPWRFSLLRQMLIWTKWEHQRHQHKEPLLDGEKAARDFRFWFRDDYFAMQSLYSLCQELMVYDIGRGRPRLSKDELLSIAAKALLQGRLVAAYEPERSYAAPQMQSDIVVAAPKPPVPEWFEIQVVWDDSGEPVRGLPIVVQPKSSSYVMRETNTEGRIHIDPVRAGPCEARCNFDGLPIVDGVQDPRINGEVVSL